MKFHVWAKPQVNFALTKAQIEMLTQASRHHYDSVCRQASNTADSDKGTLNGFLTQWAWSQQHNDDTADAFRLDYPLTADNRMLQTCLKCLELPLTLNDSAETIAMQQELRRLLWLLLDNVRKAGNRWREYVEA